MGVAAIAGALVGGAVAGVVAAASANGSGASTATSPAGAGPVATAAVVRTSLATSVQVGGSIAYEGSYTIVAPSGASAPAVAQAQQAVAQDEQTLAADERTEADTSSADVQATSAEQSDVNTAAATLSSDRASKTRDCSRKRGSTAACAQDAQTLRQDQTQLTQAQQQLTAAKTTATLDHDQNGAKVGSDQTKLQGDQATLTSLRATATNPGTTYTWLPKVGEIIQQDRPVYSVSNQPVPLLYGSIAAYRAFYVGMSNGADVGELTHDVIALGFGAGLAQSNHYSSATAAVVKRWQRSLGLPATGEILLGQVVFQPGTIRVTAVTASVGDSVGGESGGGGGVGPSGGGGGGGTVLTATGTTPIVSVELDVTQEYLVKRGDAVSVVLANGSSTVGGHVQSVGRVAVCPGGGGIGAATGSPTGASADQSPCESTGSGNSSSPTVTVTITLDRTPPGAAFDQEPVNVNITTQRAVDVLAVPVNALLALRGGGFGVDVVTGSRSRLVGVTTGLYSNTLVQVSGAGIIPGTRVEVPAS